MLEKLLGFFSSELVFAKNVSFIKLKENQRRKCGKEMACFVVPNSKVIFLFETISQSPVNTASKETKDEKLLRRKLFLHWALAKKRPSLIRDFFYQIQNTELSLVDLGNFLSAKNSDKTLFHLACQEGNIELLKFILDFSQKVDFDFNQADSQANTALHLIITNRKVNALKCLLEFMAVNGKLNKLNFNLKNMDGFTPLHLALNQGFVEAVRLLCDYGYKSVDLDMEREDGGVCLAKALEDNTCGPKIKEKLLQALVKSGAKPTASLMEKLGLESSGPDKIRNLILEGGGVKGIAYGGALENASGKLFDWKEIVNVGGTSAGAIVASLIAVGYTFGELKDLLEKFDYLSLLDHNEPLKRDLFDLMKKFHLFKFLKIVLEMHTHLVEHDYGLFDGQGFLDFIERLIAAKLGKHATFQELAERIERENELEEKEGGGGSQLKYLFLVGSNLKTGQSDIFSHLTTPHMIISDAVRISMSLPFIWPSHKYYIKDERGERVVHPHKRSVNFIDGGIFKNYPIEIFDRKISTDQSEILYTNYETIGFRLSALDHNEVIYGENNSENENGLVVYLKSVLGFFLNKENKELKAEKRNEKRTVFIDTLEYETIDFALSEKDKETLLKCGHKAVDEYYEFKFGGKKSEK